LLEANGTHYFYDAEGNLVRKLAATGQEWYCQWSEAGRLTSVLRPDGQLVRFTYDALGRRLSKHYRGQVTRWVWDGNVPLHEWTSLEVEETNVEDVITWLFEEDSFTPLAKLQGQQHYSVVSDHLGTPLELHGGGDTPVWTAELDSYGRVRRREGEGTACPFRFQGQYEDQETGLYYNRFRYYDPEAGQYISPDPIGLMAVTPLFTLII
jgi:RHS repeat-associated protein